MISFVVEPMCKICGRQLPFSLDAQTTCLPCSIKPPSYTLARAILQFDEHSKSLIHAFKYYDQTYLAKVFAQIMFNMYPNLIEQYDLIVPVPMHWLKRMMRFYNQADLLAKELSLLSKKKVCHNTIIKSKWTKSQTALKKSERKTNLSNSFKLVRPELVAGKKVILIDDVLTTGSTVSACTKELMKSAKSVFVLCVANNTKPIKMIF